MRTFLILIFIGVFGISVSGQGKNEAAFLQLSFDIKNKYFCFGDSVDFVAKLTNTSRNPVVIDVNRIGSLNYFDRYISKTKKEPYGSFASGHGWAAHYKPNFIDLQPMESYTKNLKFVFDDDYFTKAGKYQMQIDYYQIFGTKFENTDVWEGIVLSNKIFISLNKCSVK